MENALWWQWAAETFSAGLRSHNMKRTHLGKVQRPGDLFLATMGSPAKNQGNETMWREKVHGGQSVKAWMGIGFVLRAMWHRSQGQEEERSHVEGHSLTAC